jgi:hypothetical protein
LSLFSISIALVVNEAFRLLVGPLPLPNELAQRGILISPLANNHGAVRRLSGLRAALSFVKVECGLTRGLHFAFAVAQVLKVAGYDHQSGVFTHRKIFCSALVGRHECLPEKLKEKS